MNSFFGKKFLPTAGEFKKLRKFFLVLFVLFVIAVNWSKVAWIFDLKFLVRGAEEIKQKQDNEQTGQSDRQSEAVFQAQEPAVPVVVEEVQEERYPQKKNSIEIAKLAVEAPIVFSDGRTNADYEAALKNGVLYYPDSVEPGSPGAVIILGHSAPAGWPDIYYDWVFTRLNDLQPGDEVIIYFNYQKYIYTVSEKEILEKGAELPADWTSNEAAKIVLLTCWPPGKDYKRVGVMAVLEK